MDAGTDGQWLDEATRVRLASRSGTPGAQLTSLAADPSVMVRAAVALNASITPDVDELLVRDSDERVRALLGGRIARLLPRLEAQQQREALAHAHRTLMVLAHDAAQRVRSAVADALASMPQAPRAVILALAADSAALVSEPVLRLSPLLTDSDLIALLANPPHAGTASAIASRSGLGEVVVDAIATHADSAAVRILLQNHSARLREATLDGLIGRAGDHPEWHEPIIRRPDLPPRAMAALVRMVGTHLLALLAERPDIPSNVLNELKQRITRALDAPAPFDRSHLLESVYRMQRDGMLTEEAAIEAARAGRAKPLAAMLAVASGAGMEAVERALARRSGKALASMAWKAGWSMQTAGLIQAVLTDVKPSERVGAAPQGGYALSSKEMNWQFGLMTERSG